MEIILPDDVVALEKYILAKSVFSAVSGVDTVQVLDMCANFTEYLLYNSGFFLRIQHLIYSVLCISMCSKGQRQGAKGKLQRRV